MTEEQYRKATFAINSIERKENEILNLSIHKKQGKRISIRANNKDIFLEEDEVGMIETRLQLELAKLQKEFEEL